MDDNQKDILLVLIGSLSSLLGSVITLTLQSRHERKLAKRAQRQKHFDEVREYLYAIISLSTFVTEYLVTTNIGMKHSPLYFQSNTNKIYERIARSSFSSVPVRIAITKDKKILSEFEKLEQYFIEIRVVIDLISKGRILTDEQIEELTAKHEKANEIMEHILDALGKTIDK